MRTHIVQKGDTLWKIAKQYGIGFEELKRLNAHLANPDYIVPGMEIILPDEDTTHSKEKTLPEKAKKIETPPKAKTVETPPKALPAEVPKEKPVEKIEKKELPKKEVPVPQIPPMPQPIPVPMPIPQQVQPAERPEFHFDFSPQFTFPTQPQVVPMPQPTPQQVPMAQPIFITPPSQVQPVQEVEKEKVVEKEYIPVPQTHIEYIPVPCPIYIPCMPQEHFYHPCPPRYPFPWGSEIPQQSPCGCGGGSQEIPQMYNQGDYYPPIMPYGQFYDSYGMGDVQYPIDGYGTTESQTYPLPEDDSVNTQQSQGELPDWLFESTSADEKGASEKIGTAGKDEKEQSPYTEEQINSFGYDDYSYYPFEQATNYQPMYGMQQGYMPYMGDAMQQWNMQHMNYYPGYMNPCAPHFRPWSY